MCMFFEKVKRKIPIIVLAAVILAAPLFHIHVLRAADAWKKAAIDEALTIVCSDTGGGQI